MAIKKTVLIIAVFFLFIGTGFAHSPQSVGATYNPLTETLTADIVHTTTSPGIHYVYRIDVLVNDKQVVSDDSIGGQSNNSGRTYTTRLKNIKAGDTIEVIAYCSRRGQKTAIITVSGNSSEKAMKETKSTTQSTSEKKAPVKTEEKQPQRKSWWE